MLGYHSINSRTCYCCDMAISAPKGRVWTIRSSQDLGRTLGDVRKLRHLTQEQLAEMTGMRRDYLSQLESSSDTLELQRLILAFRRLGADITVTVEAPGDAS
jgi:DNA-binding XRE family transcriptional regulator